VKIKSGERAIRPSEGAEMGGRDVLMELNCVWDGDEGGGGRDRARGVDVGESDSTDALPVDLKEQAPHAKKKHTVSLRTLCAMLG
jgi:hypothetical protein